MKNRLILVFDAVINFTLGILLFLSVLFSETMISFLGVPKIENAFYPSLFGAILIGIGVALLVEAFRGSSRQMVGLGLGGAIAINLCGGVVLIGWLVFGDLNIPIRGQIFLWVIAGMLLVISTMEWLTNR